MKKRTINKVKNVARTTALTAAGATICGASALLNVALAPIYVGANVINGGVKGYQYSKKKNPNNSNG